MSTHVPTAPDALSRARDLVEPCLRSQVARIPDAHMRTVAAYQLGWCDADGRPASGHGGKAVRPALVLLGAEAVGADPAAALPAAAAVELVHNFSLLHDDVMDRDVERRHRPTGWAAFGEPAAVLAGNAMLLAAIDAVVDAGPVVSSLLATTQRLISGQSDDVLFEGADDVSVAQVLHMEAGKTAQLLSCAASIGALAAGGDPRCVDALARFGHHVGMAFQLVDDVLGICGDPAVTGKSASSDLRTGKRSAPLVAVLAAPGPTADRLRDLLADGPPGTDEGVARAAALVAEAGGIAWALREADSFLAAALAELDSVPLAEGPAAELAAIAHYVVDRDR